MHSDDPPYTATFEHTIPGPAKGVVADCLWWPPIIPAPAELPAHARVRERTIRERSSAANSNDSFAISDSRDERAGSSSAEDSTEDDDIQEPVVTVMLFIPGMC